MTPGGSKAATVALLTALTAGCGEPSSAPPDAALWDAGAPDAAAAVCGNGVAEPGEQCDDANDDDGDVCANDCTLNVADTHDVAVKWWFNRNDALGFDGDACTDLGVDRVEVELELFAQPSVRYVRSEICALRQVSFLGVPVGEYQIRVRPFDADGVLMTDGAVLALAVIAPPIAELEIDVDPDEWSGEYTGTFFFRLRWGESGADCQEALPPVAQHVLLLEQDGAPVQLQTDVGDPIDGSAPGPCRSLVEELPQVVDGVAFGPARFTVVGLDDVGGEAYRAAFDTFIGAGLSNPELLFDVAPAMPAE